MKISLNWLKRFLDIDLSPEEISVYLTNCGLEVEGYERFESIKGGLKGVVVGEVLTCRKHPNADKLSLTTVNVGSEEALPIVCGAPNVAAGQKVLVATVGTVLYQGVESFTIKEAKIRGEKSMGMICAEDELGLGESHDGIMVLPPDIQVGIPASQYFEVYEDVVFEIGLTPNRSDAYSHFGVARDLLAVLKTADPLKYEKIVLQWPDILKNKKGNEVLEIPVQIDNNADCPRYTSQTFSGIEVKDSPLWMQQLLRAAGLRPINNVVDITNFVLLETGQPLHAFDADKIQGAKVLVRKLPKETPFFTLDGVERKLSGEDLMICNENAGMCMAGVYGGMESGVTANTKRIFLESAYFNPVTIRKTSRYHGLKTDSSQRFERGANPEMTVYALQRAGNLFCEFASAEESSDIQDYYPIPVPWNEIKVNYQRIDSLIGKSIPKDTIQGILIHLGIRVLQADDKGLLISVPPFKTDVTREAPPPW